MQAATQEFQIDGTWSDPRVTKMDSTPQAPASGEAAGRTGSLTGESRRP